MKWTRIAVRTKAETADIIISAFYDIGLEGAQIEEIFSGKREDDEVCLYFYIEKDSLDVEELIPRLKAELEDISAYAEIGEGTVAVSVTEDKEWIDNWKEYFHAFTIDDLQVVPAWEEAKEDEEHTAILRIDPGTSFGTGAHETTNLCIRQIQKYVTEDTVMLDIGCGSGILGIAALLYGARQVKGTDVAPCAIEATACNRKINHIRPERYEAMLGDLISDRGFRDSLGYACYDIITANILPDVLLPLLPHIYEKLKNGGICILSGIIREKEKDVKEALRASGMNIIGTAHQGQWTGITAGK